MCLRWVCCWLIFWSRGLRASLACAAGELCGLLTTTCRFTMAGCGALAMHDSPLGVSCQNLSGRMSGSGTPPDATARVVVCVGVNTSGARFSTICAARLYNLCGTSLRRARFAVCVNASGIRFLTSRCVGLALLYVLVVFVPPEPVARFGDSRIHCRYCIVNIHSWPRMDQFWYRCPECNIGRICQLCQAVFPGPCVWCCTRLDPGCRDVVFWTEVRLVMRRRVLNGHHYLFRPNYEYTDTDTDESSSD
jgi:hypothetical protein